jgi:peptidoglycan/LPS O-acetylase OafA/YrhL
MLAIFVAAAGAVVAAVLVVGSVLQGGRVEDMAPTGLAVVALGIVAALVINAFGRKAARRRRPEWLETQAWRSGLQDKLAQAQVRDNARADASVKAASDQPKSMEEPGPRGG